VHRYQCQHEQSEECDPRGRSAHLKPFRKEQGRD
jgi:hypothetical protein